MCFRDSPLEWLAAKGNRLTQQAFFSYPLSSTLAGLLVVRSVTRRMGKGTYE